MDMCVKYVAAIDIHNKRDKSTGGSLYPSINLSIGHQHHEGKCGLLSNCYDMKRQDQDMTIVAKESVH